MDAIQFIENDVARGQRARTALLAGAVCLAYFLLPPVMGLLMRESLGGAFAPRVLVPNLLAIALAAGATLILFRGTVVDRRAFWAIVLGIGLASMLATERVFFPAGDRTSYASLEAFWHETNQCLWKGSLATFLGGLLLGICSFKASSLPTRRRRALIAALAAAGGVIMLGFHCDSSSAAHVGIGHLAQGALIGLAVFLVQNRVFFVILRKSLPGIESSARQPWRL